MYLLIAFLHDDSSIAVVYRFFRNMIFSTCRIKFSMLHVDRIVSENNSTVKILLESFAIGLAFSEIATSNMRCTIFIYRKIDGALDLTGLPDTFHTIHLS